MACKFSIPFSSSAEEVVNKSKTAVVNQGGSFTGDTSSGSFRVNVLGSGIKGTYTITGNEFNIVIESKSFLIPCSAIENYLKKEIE